MLRKFSLSSGGRNLYQETEKLIEALWMFQQVKFVPFTGDEFDIYAKLCLPTNLDKEKIREITNNNPCLLSMIKPSEDLESTQVRVDAVVQRFVCSIIRAVSELSVWAKRRLPEIVHYCQLASNQEDISEDEITNFRSTWIATENVLYVNNNKLYYNFPRMHMQLMTHITVEVADNDPELLNNPIVKAFYFEWKICGGIASEKSNFTIQKNSETVKPKHV